MNVFILDPNSEVTVFSALESLRDYLPAEKLSIAIAQQNADSTWCIKSDDRTIVCTQMDTAGIVPLILLATDLFDSAVPLIVLTDVIETWPIHLERLGQAKPHDDAFLSFADDNTAEPCTKSLSPALSPLLDLSAAVVPALVRFFSTERFYGCARSAIRKDSRLGGGFSLGCVVRELYLSHADISYQTHDDGHIAAPTRVSEHTVS
jgi:hypothetical protein